MLNPVQHQNWQCDTVKRKSKQIRLQLLSILSSETTNPSINTHCDSHISNTVWANSWWTDWGNLLTAREVPGLHCNNQGFCQIFHALGICISTTDGRNTAPLEHGFWISNSNLALTFPIPVESTVSATLYPARLHQIHKNLQAWRNQLKTEIWKVIKPFYKHLVNHWTKETVPCKQMVNKQPWACTGLLILHQSSSTRSHFRVWSFYPKWISSIRVGEKERNKLGSSDGVRRARNSVIKTKS